MARMDGELVAVFHRLADLVDVGEIDLGIDALGEHVEAQRHQIDVAGALAVAEQAAFNAVGAGHEAQFGRRDSRSAVVVGMQAEDDRVAVLEVAMAPFDLVGIYVGRGHLDGGGQVDDHLLLRSGLVDVAHRGADVARELELGAGEALRRILEYPFGLRIGVGELLHQFGARHGNLDDAGGVLSEHDSSLQRRGRVVEMDDGALGAAAGLEGALDQFGPALRQHLDGDVVRDHLLLDQLAHELEIGLRRRREADLDFLVAHLDEELEHPRLAVGVHGFDQRLVAVAQVDRAPDRRLGDDGIGPLAVGQGHRLEGDVLLGCGRHHRFLDGHFDTPRAAHGQKALSEHCDGKRGRRLLGGGIERTTSDPHGPRNTGAADQPISRSVVSRSMMETNFLDLMRPVNPSRRTASAAGNCSRPSRRWPTEMECGFLRRR